MSSERMYSPAEVKEILDIRGALGRFNLDQGYDGNEHLKRAQEILAQMKKYSTFFGHEIDMYEKTIIQEKMEHNIQLDENEKRIYEEWQHRHSR